MERGIVDRIEGNFAVVETDFGMKNMSKIDKLHEGDCILFENDMIISIDYEETQKRRILIEERLKKLKNK